MDSTQRRAVLRKQRTGCGASSEAPGASLTFTSVLPAGSCPSRAPGSLLHTFFLKLPPENPSQACENAGDPQGV